MFSHEFYALVIITLVTVITPGPDFVVVVKNTVSVSRRAGFLTAFGIATAIWVHIFYSIVAVQFVATQSEFIFEVIRLLGASYLFWLGWKSLTSTPQPLATKENEIQRSAFWKQGFINNLLNPKATLFFISIFSQVVAPNTPLFLQVGYGVVITIICFSWLCFISIMLTIDSTKPYVNKIVQPVEKIAGVIFVSYASIEIYNSYQLHFL
ncbi:LysE family translocator [Moritella sp. 36]|uniref:LysE family translocator n=1 Tax=Moritella sp. 36 TaxID=2746233 RepID=UPI001BA66941|nr:LysE family translocator [Moritella sp. 36]QUM90473.1 LysE family translocator [Moritella sp. 36]